MEFTGSRYVLSGLKLPHLKPWMIEVMGIDLNEKSYSVPNIDTDKVPKPVLNNEFMEVIHNIGMELSIDPIDR